MSGFPWQRKATIARRANTGAAFQRFRHLHGGKCIPPVPLFQEINGRQTGHLAKDGALLPPAELL
jgi:hypothetical protein